MPDTNRPDHLMKVIIPRARLDTVLKELYAMNISRATLFPGLDGFAQSLRMNLGSVPYREEFPPLD